MRQNTDQARACGRRENDSASVKQIASPTTSPKTTIPQAPNTASDDPSTTNSKSRVRRRSGTAGMAEVDWIGVPLESRDYRSVYGPRARIPSMRRGRKRNLVAGSLTLDGRVADGRRLQDGRQAAGVYDTRDRLDFFRVKLP